MSRDRQEKENTLAHVADFELSTKEAQMKFVQSVCGRMMGKMTTTPIHNAEVPSSIASLERDSISRNSARMTCFTSGKAASRFQMKLIRQMIWARN